MATELQKMETRKSGFKLPKTFSNDQKNIATLN